MKDVIYWLRKTPQPVAILADDKRIEVPKTGRSWKDLKATIDALEPSKLTCLDGQGGVIRSITLESDDDKPAASAEMSDVQLFAKEIATAYDRGSKVNEPLINAIMSFLEKQSQTLAKVEADRERLRNENLKLRQHIVQASGAKTPADEESILGALLGGILQGQAAAGAQLATAGADVTPITKGGQKK